MINHRGAHRPLSLLKGRVIFPDRPSTMDCVVRDLSDGGARPQIGHHVAVPDRFDLYMRPSGRPPIEGGLLSAMRGSPRPPLRKKPRR
jgi:hypothetical protein